MSEVPLYTIHLSGTGDLESVPNRSKGLMIFILVYLVMYDPGKVSLQRFLLSWYPSQRVYQCKLSAFSCSN